MPLIFLSEPQKYKSPLFLKNISINQFKSHSQLSLELINGINIICGKNGVGKTNILDAVYVLLNGKSYFHTTDSLCVKQNENFFMIKGSIITSNDEAKLMVSFQQGKRKVIKNDENPIAKLAEYFGKYPCVMIAPDDVEIINGESENRRDFFDYLFSILDKNYFQNLVMYQKALESRNRQLKIFLENDKFDEVIIEYYDNLLEKYGLYIFKTRNELTPVFKEYFDKAYCFLSNGNDIALFKYISQLQVCNFKEGLIQNLAKDRILGRTTYGIHRDDWQFELNNLPLKKTGSQGQIKSFLISLKIAMYNLICERKLLKPIMLLDDIFEKIDSTRMEKLTEILAESKTGQVIITDTNKKRMLDIFKKIKNVNITEL